MLFAYLFTRLDSILTIIHYLLPIFFIMVVGSFVAYLMMFEEKYVKKTTLIVTKNIFKKSLLTLCILLFIKVLLPTQKEAAFIWLAPKIVNNEDITDTAKNIPELAKLGTEYLKAILEDKVNAASRNS